MKIGGAKTKAKWTIFADDSAEREIGLPEKGHATNRVPLTAELARLESSLVAGDTGTTGTASGWSHSASFLRHGAPWGGLRRPLY